VLDKTANAEENRQRDSFGGLSLASAVLESAQGNTGAANLEVLHFEAEFGAATQSAGGFGLSDEADGWRAGFDEGFAIKNDIFGEGKIERIIEDCGFRVEGVEEFEIDGRAFLENYGFVLSRRRGL
jgi:hypothetical protein